MSFKSFSRYTVAGLLTLTASYALAVPGGTDTVFSNTVAENINFADVALTLDQHSPDTLTSASYTLSGVGKLLAEVFIDGNLTTPSDAEVTVSFDLQLVGPDGTSTIDQIITVAHTFGIGGETAGDQGLTLELEELVDINFSDSIPQGSLGLFEGTGTVEFLLSGMENDPSPAVDALQPPGQDPIWVLTGSGVHSISETQMSITYNWEEDTGPKPPVPAPGAVVLLGIGLLGLGAVRRRRTA